MVFCVHIFGDKVYTSNGSNELMLSSKYCSDLFTSNIDWFIGMLMVRRRFKNLNDESFELDKTIVLVPYPNIIKKLHDNNSDLIAFL